MPPSRLLALFLVGPLLVVTACYAARPCYPVAEAPAHPGKDICLTAHVYDIVPAPNGDRYLDVCPTDGAACDFTVVSLAADQASVGSLDAIEGHDIQLRGIVRSSEAGSFMLLSESRQLHGGAEKFHPNPELLEGFNAGSSATAFKDPATRGHHTHTASVFRGVTQQQAPSAAPCFREGQRWRAAGPADSGCRATPHPRAPG